MTINFLIGVLIGLAVLYLKINANYLRIITKELGRIASALEGIERAK